MQNIQQPMFVNLHTHHPLKNNSGIEIVNIDLHHLPNQLPPLCSAGIHPWNINNNSIKDLEILKRLAGQKSIIAIGECGLDKLRGPDLNMQMEVFNAQIELSESLQLPLIIHCIKSYSEIIKLRKDYQPQQPWIFHGFNASAETCQQALKHGFYFSFGNSLFKKQSKGSKAIPLIPTNRLFLETDDEKQLSIALVYQRASELLKIETSQLQAITKNNFKQLFNVD
ncbi:MAG: TatD family hydrolase [Carboxylicivirga sp.]|nr:TatD family hydrolase [Carboxylicivirga sp.]